MTLDNLSDLLNETSQKLDSSQVSLIKLTDIEQDTKQVRSASNTGFSDEAINELKESIESVGLLTPITVQPIENHKYKIICGERRFRAFKVLGRDEIPAFVKNFDNANEVKVYQLTENLQRVDLSLFELAKTVAGLVEQNQTQLEVCRLLGKKPYFVTELLSINSLPQWAVDYITSGKLSSSRHFLYMLSVQIKKNEKAAKEYIDLRLETRDIVDRGDIKAITQYVDSGDSDSSIESHNEDFAQNSLEGLTAQPELSMSDQSFYENNLHDDIDSDLEGEDNFADEEPGCNYKEESHGSLKSNLTDNRSSDSFNSFASSKPRKSKNENLNVYNSKEGNSISSEEIYKAQEQIAQSVLVLVEYEAQLCVLESQSESTGKLYLRADNTFLKEVDVNNEILIFKGFIYNKSI